MAQNKAGCPIDSPVVSARVGRYTTLPIAAGAYPFALGKDENLTNDQWAWSFLRLNPFYRHDFMLQRNRPPSLNLPRHRSIAEHVGNPPPLEFRELDSRYFRARGRILSGKCTWPDYVKQTIAEYRDSDSAFRLSEVEIRDFDSASDYGIAAWFDPALEQLPPLKPGQSWFYCLVEPIWASASRDITLAADGDTALLPDGRKVFVGLTGEARRMTVQTALRRKSRHLPDGSGLSWLENIVDEADKTIPLDSGFATRTELVFLIDLDMYIDSQLAQVRRVASSIQRLLQEEGLSRKLPRPPPGFEPLVFHPSRAVAKGFSQICQAYEDMTSRHAQAKRNCRVILLDAAYSLPNQMSDLASLLTAEQEKLQAAGELRHPVRRKAGNATGGDHWLKRALCLLELHVDGYRHGDDKLWGPTRLSKVIFDPRDKSYSDIRGEQSSLPLAKRASPAKNMLDDSVAAKLDGIKEALNVGKNLSEFGYTYLVGMPE